LKSQLIRFIVDEDSGAIFWKIALGLTVGLTGGFVAKLIVDSFL